MWFLILLLVLAVGGRWACSRICPLGILQELIFKIPFPKKYTKLPGEKQLKKIKYIIFATLLVAIPLVFLPNREEWHTGFLVLKLLGFTTVFLLALPIFRPFCKYLCPFGVFLGLFNKLSPVRYEVKETCNQCGACRRMCSMGVAPYCDPNSMECIRCGKCVSKCPRKAICRADKLPGRRKGG